jgi:hypothetical protein
MAQVTSEVTGFAERFLVTFLTRAGAGDEDLLLPYLGYRPDLTGVDSGAWYVSHTAAVAVEPRQSGWLVTLVADLLARVEGGYVPTQTAWFTVEIGSTEKGLRALGLPEPAAAPPAPVDGVARIDLIDSANLATAERLVSEHLLATGDVYRMRELRSLSVDPVVDLPAARAVVAVEDESGRILIVGVGLPVVSAGTGTWTVLDVLNPESR